MGIKFNPLIFSGFDNAGSSGGGGNVTGPGSSTNNAVPTFNGTSGQTLNNTGVLIDGSNNLSTPGTITGSNLSGTNTGDVTLTAVGASPSANGATLSGQALTLQPADATHPGLITTGTQTFAGAKTFTGAISASNISGTNSGDVTLTAFGSSPNANGASISGQAITLQPANATNPGGVSTTTQSFGGNKTFTGSLRSNTSLILEDPGAGTNTITIQSPTLSAGYTLTLPVDDGTTGQILTTDGSGVLSWTTSTSGANTALSNLASVAINTSLLPNADATINLGSASFRWLNAYLTGIRNGSDKLIVDVTSQRLQNSNEILKVDFAGSGVNVSTDTNGSIVLTADGTGRVQISPELQLLGSTSGFVGIKSPAAPTSYTITLPTDDGTSGQVLTTDGSGITSWTTSTGGANTALSNLSSVAINTDLLPGTDLSINLGSSTKTWAQAYVQNILDSSGTGSVDIDARVLRNSTGTGLFDFSGANLSVSAVRITGVADPTSAQDAATKAYVDAAVGGPSWTKYTLSYTDFSTAGTTNDVELFSLAAKETIHQIIIHHTAAFTGGAITAYTLSVGIGGNFTKYTSSFDVFQTASDTVFQSSTDNNMEDFGSATSIRIQAKSTGDNLDQAATGSVDVYVQTSSLP